jgi:hypothetical protein
METSLIDGNDMSRLGWLMFKAALPTIFIFFVNFCQLSLVGKHIGSRRFIDAIG